MKRFYSAWNIIKFPECWPVALLRPKISNQAQVKARTKRKHILMVEREIYDKLTEIFEEVFDDDSIVVAADLTAKDVDGWDSVAHIRLLVTIEKAFKLKFSTAEIAKLKTVGDLVALIKDRV